MVYLGLGLLLPLLGSMAISLVALLVCRCARSLKAARWSVGRDRVTRTSTSGVTETSDVTSKWAEVRRRLQTIDAFRPALKKKKVAFD